MIGDRTAFRRTEVGLVTAAFFAPFSATRIVGSLTLGRTAAIAFAVLLTADLLAQRPVRWRFDRPAVLLAAAYLGLCAWALLSAATWGCNCGGKLGGFFEFALIGLLALVAIGFAPRLRGTAMAAALAGLVLAAVLALAGAGSINSGTVDMTQTGGRLSGTFGNANELGFAVALAIPIALAYRPFAGPRGRIACVVAVLVLATTLVLTYSRGAIIAAALGIVALAIWQAAGSRRRIAAILVAGGIAAVAAAILYASFEEERRDASFVSVSPSLRTLDQRDLSGWDSRALGPIPHGPSTLLDRGAGIAVRASRAGEGASFRWGEAEAGGVYVLRFRARADSAGLPFSYALADSAHELEGPQATGKLSRDWRRFSLAWRPPSRSAHAALYLWQTAGPSTFAVSEVEVIARERSRPTQVVAIPQELEGSLYERLASTATRAERRYMRSRLDAARLAFRAFRSEPLRGIGWGTFPAYADAHLDYGLLAAHDEYLAVAAELGIVGALLLALMVAALALGIRAVAARRARQGSPGAVGAPEAAAIGVLAAAAAGMVFVEALSTPQLSIPIALAAAVICAGRERSGERG